MCQRWINKAKGLAERVTQLALFVFDHTCLESSTAGHQGTVSSCCLNVHVQEKTLWCIRCICGKIEQALFSAVVKQEESLVRV